MSSVQSFASRNRNVLLDVLPKTAMIAPAFSWKFSKIKSNEYSPQFPVQLMSKDLNLVQSVAGQSGAELPAGSATRRIFQETLADRGELDISAVAPYVQELAKGSNPVS